MPAGVVAVKADTDAVRRAAGRLFREPRATGRRRLTSPMLVPGEQRQRPAVSLLPYLLLAVLVVITVTVRRSSPRPLLVDLVLCALAAGWMLVLFTVQPAWRQRPSVMAVFLGGLIVVMAVLVVRDPWFGFFTPALYLYAFRLLPWPGRLSGVAAVALVSGTAQAYAVDKATPAGVLIYLAVLLANVIPMCGFAVFAWRSAERNAERERVLVELSEANRRLETALADNVRLHEQLLVQARQAGVQHERQRMAREIHDTLAQGLTGIVTQLQAASYASERPVDWRRHLDAATDLARESLSEARRSVHELRPAPLETARLGEALADVAERWSALHGIAIQVTTTGPARPMRPETEFALLRTAQEALANVAKHAQATRAGLTLSYLDDEVALDVRDDGRGIAAQADAGGGGGFGLVAMRQRIESLAGTLHIESTPGGGTGISACVPVARTGAVA